MKFQSGSNQKEKGKVVVQILKQKTQLTDCQLRFIFLVVPPGIEPGTQGFSVLCSTN